MKKIIKIILLIFLLLVLLTISSLKDNVTHTQVTLGEANSKTAKEWIEIGKKYEEKEVLNYSLALTAYEKALKVSNNEKEKKYIKLHIIMNIKYLKKVQKAKEMAEKEISDKQEHIILYSDLVDTYIRLNEPYDKIIKIENKAKNKIENSIEYTQEEKNWAFYLLYYNLTGASMLNGRKKIEDSIIFSTKASKYIDQAIKQRLEEWWMPYYNTSLGIYMLFYDEAIEILLMLYNDPSIKKNQHIINQLGNFYKELDNYELAEKYYLESSEMGNSMAKRNLKKLYIKMGKTTDN